MLQQQQLGLTALRGIRRSQLWLLGGTTKAFVARWRWQSTAAAASNSANGTGASATTATAAAAAAVRPYLQGEETHFGYASVPIAAKEDRVRTVFESVADNYDVMNDLMSAGMHRLWKDHLLRVSGVGSIAAAVRRQQQHRSTTATTTHDGEGAGGAEFKILDVAGGTGDVAFRFVDAAGCAERAKSSGQDPIQVTVCDINLEMLRVGERRAMDRYGPALLHTQDSPAPLRFVQGNAQDLAPSFPDNTFDLYTIAFGLRNVTDVDRALREAHRVLKPGGRFLCLEFSQLQVPIVQCLYDLYSFNAIPALGQAVAGDRESYQYLVESIRKFSNQHELLQRMEQASMVGCKYTNLTGGVVALHEGWKAL
jgi:ubiquinone/menaquinone biosynthesis methyltransferase